jgi:hypothetical protein
MTRDDPTSQRRRGMALAAVLAASFFAIFMWSQSYLQLHSVLWLQERAQTGLSGKPGLGDALARAMACLSVTTPPTATYRCRLGLGEGPDRKTFTLDYTATVTETWTVRVFEGQYVIDPLCPSCPTAGAGP